MIMRMGIKKIFFEKIINSDISDLFDFNNNKNNGHQYITLDANGKFQNLDSCLFCSDAKKINEAKFVVFLTKKYSNELIICLFDLYNNDSSLRLRYYQLDLDLINIKISFNLRAFVFKSYFGLVFYDLYRGYPGYLFFNYPTLADDDKINSTTVGIKLIAYVRKPYIFSFKDNLEIINNIYGGKEKIKIINYSGLHKTGVVVKSSKLNSEIYSNQILDIDDKLIFEQSLEGIILGDHILEFIPLIILSNEDNNVCETFHYGNAKDKDFDEFEYLSNETFKIIYTIECHEQCSEDENGNIIKQEEILKNIKNEIQSDLNMTKLENGEDIIIQSGQITFTITSTDQQNNLKKISNNMPIIDFNECKQVLIDNNIIEKNQNLYLLKLDIQEKGIKTPKVEYELYYQPNNSQNLSLLDISLCENTRIDILLPININQDEIDMYNDRSDYYNDICESVTSEDGTDIHIKDRQKEYIENNMRICEEECYFSKYDFILKKVVCSCLTKTKLESISEMKLNNSRTHSNFKEVKNNANFELLKCFTKVFNNKRYMNNSANYINLIIFIISIIILILYILKGYTKIKNFVEETNDSKNSNMKMDKEENKSEIKGRKERRGIRNTDNKPKNFASSGLSINNNNNTNLNEGEIDSKQGLDIDKNSNKNEEQVLNSNKIIDNKESSIKENEVKIYSGRKKSEADILFYNDYELNYLNYEKAKKYDERTFCQYYSSLIKSRHILISNFCKGNSYNLGIIKKYLLLFSFAINYSICILFYNYKTFHKIYEEKGKFNFGYQIPKIIYSSLITVCIIILVSKLILLEGNFLAIKNAKNENLKNSQKKELNITFWKLVIFFVVTYILLFFFWIYSISFCVVYKNTQTHLLVNGIISFIISCVIPFILYLIPGIFRVISLRKGEYQRNLLYNVSKYLQICLC